MGEVPQRECPSARLGLSRSALTCWPSGQIIVAIFREERLMRTLVLALVLGLAAPLSAHAQTVTLRACNPGKTEVDVYFAQGTNIVSQHVAPSYCANLASAQGAMAPGLVAVGFADLRGQWGGVHRYERVPNFGPGVAQSTTQTLSVTHGATRVSIPAQFTFQPPKAQCVTYRGQLGPQGQVPEYTRCDDFKYDVNVLAFPDTREVAFQLFCQSCDDHAEERKTPEVRALEKQVADLKKAAVDVLPMSMRIQVERDTKRVDSREESNDRYREMLERDPTKWDRIGWSDVPRYAREVASNVPNVAMQGSVAVVQGTLSGMQRHNASDPWFDVFFQESPDHKFILCTQQPDVLSDIFGASYATAMVGKKIEVEGRVVGCLGGAPGILLKLAHQIKLVGTGAGMVAAVTPPAFKFPEDPNRRGLPAVPSPPTREQMAAETAQHGQPCRSRDEPSRPDQTEKRMRERGEQTLRGKPRRRRPDQGETRVCRVRSARTGRGRAGRTEGRNMRARALDARPSNAD